MVKDSNKVVGTACLLVTAVGWALNWLAMKWLLYDWPPLFARGVAGIFASLMLFALARYRGEGIAVPRAAWARLAFSAFTNVFAWMGFSSLAIKWLSVGEGALLVYTMPIWSMLFAWPLLGIKPTARSFTALALGFGGMLFLLGNHVTAVDESMVLGIVSALAAATLFALGSVLNNKPFPLSPIAVVAWQVGLGCIPLWVIGMLFEHPHVQALSGAGFAALAYMTVMPMGICYLTWFAAVRHLTPPTAAIGMLLVPLFSVILAAFIFHEPLGWRELVSMALILGGVTLIVKRR